jgi:sulfur carrier protein ThiS
VDIKVTLHGILRDYLPRPAKGQTIVSLPAGTTVSEVVQRLQIKQNVSAAIAGVEVEQSQVLQEGDDLHLFRLIAGG